MQEPSRFANSATAISYRSPASDDILFISSHKDIVISFLLSYFERFGCSYNDEKLLRESFVLERWLSNLGLFAVELELVSIYSVSFYVS